MHYSPAILNTDTTDDTFQEFEQKISSDTKYMKVQAHSSPETPFVNNKNQMPLRSQGQLRTTFKPSLEVRGYNTVSI